MLPESRVIPLSGFFPARWDCPRPRGSPGGASGKEPTCQCRRHKRCRFDPLVGKILWRQQGNPLQCSHGQRSIEGYSPWGHRESDTTEETEQVQGTCRLCWGTATTARLLCTLPQRRWGHLPNIKHMSQWSRELVCKTHHLSHLDVASTWEITMHSCPTSYILQNNKLTIKRKM